MRVQYVHRGYLPARAGAELMTQCLAVEMSRRGRSVGLYCAGVDEGSAEAMTGAGISVAVLPGAGAGDDGRPDLVHAVDAVWADYPQAALELARRWQVPFVFTPASATEVWQDPAAVEEVCRRADAVLVLTEAERATMRAAGVRPEALHRIGQGAHLAGVPDPDRFRAEHGIGDAPVILFVGRKMRSKGYLVLLEAAPLVWEHHPDARFVFMGPDWDDDCGDLFAAHADPRIIDLGLAGDEEKHSALAACAMLCLPSTVDVFPLVYVEAWSLGKPVIAAPFRGGDEVVEDGHDGLVVEPDPGTVADAVNALLSDPATAAALGRNGLAKVREHHNWQSVADQVDQIYASLVEPQGREGSIR